MLWSFSINFLQPRFLAEIDPTSNAGQKPGGLQISWSVRGGAQTEQLALNVGHGQSEALREALDSAGQVTTTLCFRARRCLYSRCGGAGGLAGRFRLRRSRAGVPGALDRLRFSYAVRARPTCPRLVERPC